MKRGFTLIELMIVVAIIAILATVAVPRFSDLLNKSKEAHVKGTLGGLRSALGIYYSDISFYPSDVAGALTNAQKYYTEIPVITIPAVAALGSPGHERVTGVKNVAAADDDTATGVFAYRYTPTDGDLSVNCTHKDSKGLVWSSY